MAHLLRREHDVDGIRHGTRLGDAIIGDRSFPAGWAKQGDAIARLNAIGNQAIGNAVGQFVELAE
jgi:hypothetical protein